MTLATHINAYKLWTKFVFIIKKEDMPQNKVLLVGRSIKLEIRDDIKA